MADAPVTALCPTYGRFESLRDAVACFLLQTYRPRRLLILNDAPVPLYPHGGSTIVRVPGATVEVWNADSRYETLGHKRQALLTAARSGLVAHWDDDDWYLPWHLSQCVDALQDGEADCVQPGGAWWCTGRRDSFKVKGPRHNVFEGQMAFDRRVAIDLGGYSPKDSGQARDLMERFKEHNSFRKWEPEKLSYCYRWGDGWTHISAAKSGAKFADGNANFGGSNPLIPDSADPVSWAMDRMRPIWGLLLRRLPDETARCRMEANLTGYL